MIRDFWAVWNGADFLICYVQLWRTKPFSKLYEASTPALYGIWKLFVPYKKKLRVRRPFS